MAIILVFFRSKQASSITSCNRYISNIKKRKSTVGRILLWDIVINEKIYVPKQRNNLMAFSASSSDKPIFVVVKTNLSKRGVPGLAAEGLSSRMTYVQVFP